MANKRFYRRKKKGRGEAKATQTFIQSESARQDGAEGNSFFLPKEGIIQTKLKVSEAGDDQEREADTMADKVVKRKPEDEKLHKKPEEEKIHKKSEDEQVHKKQEDEKLHKKADDKKEEQVHKKPAAGSGGAAPGVAAPRAAGKGEGSSLPASMLGEMSSSFGYDFGNVKIHTDRQAQEMNEQLGAQAFTYKGDIYFNEGKFDPGTREGKWLLAHELTHVVQQKGDNGPVVQKKDVPGISTPVPDTFTVVKKKEVILSATGQVKGVKVVVLPDTVGAVRPGKAADTHIDIPYHISSPMINVKDRTIQKAGKVDVYVRIQTVYVDADAHAGPAGTGRGTTKEDKAAGNTSVQFHEGLHGVSAIDFVTGTPLPKFEGRDGMTEKAYNEAVKKYDKALTDYKDALIQANIQAVHCMGTVDPDCKTPKTP